MTNTDFHTDILPHLPDALLAQMQARYPNIRLQPEAGFRPLTAYPVCMVVGLTGTGKSTTLAQLETLRGAGEIAYAADIPSRRELADWLVIPTAQILSGEAVGPVKGREARFGYTRTFAQAVSGGLAAAFSWLYYRAEQPLPLVSEGVRGPGEIRYVLENIPAWRVFELWVPPLVRLQRLSGRNDSFDQVAHATADVSFLPADDQATARSLLAQGLISPEALTTIAAEARNYGHQPYDPANQTGRYHYLNIEHTPPAHSAALLRDFITEMELPDAPGHD